MEESGFVLPDYVGTKQANSEEGEVTDYPTDIRISSQANVWLSGIKLACSDLSPKVRAFHLKKVMDAAGRYGILDDLKSATAFIKNMDAGPRPIRTEGDWQRSKEWLQKNADFMEQDIREGIVEHLFTKAAELNYVPLLSEVYTLNQIAGREDVIPEIQKLAEESLHKLATGTHYTTDQFAALPFDEVNQFLPELIKKASFEMPVLHPKLFAQAAESADRNSALVLDALFRKHGQSPVDDDSHLPLEINDAILAKL
jgi:hypothetical protein